VSSGGACAAAGDEVVLLAPSTTSRVVLGHEVNLNRRVATGEDRRTQFRRRRHLDGRRCRVVGVVSSGVVSSVVEASSDGDDRQVEA
jgi:hypothetical protein